MMNAVPKDDVPEVTRMLRGRAQFLFVTDLEENFYESFGPSWDSFVETIICSKHLQLSSISGICSKSLLGYGQSVDQGRILGILC